MRLFFFNQNTAYEVRISDWSSDVCSSDRGIDLEPQHKIGPAAARMAVAGLDRERVDEHREIARANGDKLLASPGLALDAITHQPATFTNRDLAMFVHRHSGARQRDV